MNRKGFTLVELAIVVAIVAILFSLAVGVYRDSRNGPTIYKTVCYKGPDIVLEEKGPNRASYETSEYYKYGDKLIFADHCISEKMERQVVSPRGVE